MFPWLCFILLVITTGVCGCSYGPEFHDFTMVEEGMTFNEVQAVMREPHKIIVHPDSGLNYALYEKERIKYFLADLPLDIKLISFHYEIDGEEFVINFRREEKQIKDSNRKNNTPFDFHVSHKHKNRKFVPNKINFFDLFTADKTEFD